MIDELAPLPGEHQVEKFNYGAFHATHARADPALARRRVGRRHRHRHPDLRRGDRAPGLPPRLSDDAGARRRLVVRARPARRHAEELREQVRLGRRQRRGDAPDRLMALAPAARRAAGAPRRHLRAAGRRARRRRCSSCPASRRPTNLANVVTQSAALGLRRDRPDLRHRRRPDRSFGRPAARPHRRADLRPHRRPRRAAAAGARGMLAIGAAVGVPPRCARQPAAHRAADPHLRHAQHPAGRDLRYTDRSVGRAPAALRWLANERLLGLPVAGLLLVTPRARARAAAPHALRPAPARHRRRRREHAPRRRRRRRACACGRLRAVGRRRGAGRPSRRRPARHRLSERRPGLRARRDRRRRARRHFARGRAGRRSPARSAA